ncbi:uncharacterized protein YbbC (DUF1343 family) [Symbiobacterium terraclitae]|uniref:Uncharacterized protein YbbC (DUF1343 family) n=1 Tax=Symbiobacterium terraclitae TaxID=557451 RepID=A0ABS4JPP1_9FIRM|nr:DUF1343 domain-containing protein [Symbiobacterium terraclitae]MBP2017504.1 uncharacterized protein YbbC (DUF1343 family) [Symbiobacterium terraclitae]
MARVRLGNEVLLADRRDLLRGSRVGIVTNHTGVNSRLESIIDLLAADPEVQVTALFSPEHGIRGDAAAGEKVGSSVDPVTGLPVHSLYGETRKPTPEMLRDVDVLLFDLQDAGVRFYTYTWTLAYCMQAAAENGKRLVVLDRPNPIGGVQVEGGVVQPGLESFVGLYPVATRHGLTHGEIATWINDRFGIGCDLTVVPVDGWRRAMWWDETGLPFVPPSPAANGLEMLTLYPGLCFLEGTNLSEGRGTALPFQVFGAPWLDERKTVAELSRRNLPGVLFRPTYFTPWTSKHKGEHCRGVQIHVVDRAAVRPVALGAHVVEAVRRLHPGKFEWVSWGRIRSLDRLSGSDLLYRAAEGELPLEDVLARWEEESRRFAAESAAYHLYR